MRRMLAPCTTLKHVQGNCCARFFFLFIYPVNPQFIQISTAWRLARFTRIDPLAPNRGKTGSLLIDAQPVNDRLVQQRRLIILGYHQGSGSGFADLSEHVDAREETLERQTRPSTGRFERKLS